MGCNFLMGCMLFRGCGTHIIPADLFEAERKSDPSGKPDQEEMGKIIGCSAHCVFIFQSVAFKLVIDLLLKKIECCIGFAGKR